MVVMTALTVRVTVCDFFFRRGTNVEDGDIKRQSNTCQRMIGVDSDGVFVNSSDTNGLMTIPGLRVEFCTREDLFRWNAFKHAAWDLLRHAFVVFAVGIHW